VRGQFQSQVAVPEDVVDRVVRFRELHPHGVNPSTLRRNQLMLAEGPFSVPLPPKGGHAHRGKSRETRESMATAIICAQTAGKVGSVNAG